MCSCDLRPGVRDFGCSGKRKRSGHGPTSASSQLERETGLEPATLCLGIRYTANAARAHRTPGAGDGTRTRDVLLGRHIALSVMSEHTTNGQQCKRKARSYHLNNGLLATSAATFCQRWDCMGSTPKSSDVAGCNIWSGWPLAARSPRAAPQTDPLPPRFQKAYPLIHAPAGGG